jgi:DNA-binding NarL/FixJ family response regulator
VLTTYDDDSWVLDAVRAGAAGYLLKATPRDRLFEAIRDTLANRHPLDASVTGHVLSRVVHGEPEPEPRAVAGLSAREREVLALLGQGLDNHEIARKLFLSEGTVRNYVSGILAKLNLADRTKAAVLAIRCGLSRLPSDNSRG